MKTNDIKKGMVVELRNGWFGIMADNMKGNTRMVDVDGLYREIGSVYSHDIIGCQTFPTDILKLGTEISQYQNSLETWTFTDIEHTTKQLELKQMVSNY